jgi:ribonuclease P protein component
MLAFQYRVHNTEFINIRLKGKRVQNDLFFCYFIYNDSFKNGSVSVIIPKKVYKKANKRNFAKRKINMYIRNSFLKQNKYKIIIQLKKTIDNIENKDIDVFAQDLFHKIYTI